MKLWLPIYKKGRGKNVGIANLKLEDRILHLLPSFWHCSFPCSFKFCDVCHVWSFMSVANSIHSCLSKLHLRCLPFADEIYSHLIVKLYFESWKVILWLEIPLPERKIRYAFVFCSHFVGFEAFFVLDSQLL